MPMRPAETRLPAANGISTQPAAKIRYGIGTSSRRFQSSTSITVQTSAKHDVDEEAQLVAVEHRAR